MQKSEFMWIDKNYVSLFYFLLKYFYYIGIAIIIFGSHRFINNKRIEVEKWKQEKNIVKMLINVGSN